MARPERERVRHGKASQVRCTLNMLLSFAQFEREVTGERIRDKIAASKQKGMWMGGLPPLGYDVADRKLVVNEAEAETVRHVYRRYAELGSVRALKEDLDRDGVVSKRRFDRFGRETGGKPLARGALYLMLQNRIYCGEIVHKDQSYPGQHAAIIDKEPWDAVQALLAANRVARKTGARATEPSLLAGLIYDDAGERMTPTHANKKGRRYRYYVTHSLIKRGRPKASSTERRVPAGDVEALVEDRIIAFLGDGGALHDALAGATSLPHQIEALTAEASSLGERWPGLPTAEKRGLFQDLISRITLKPDCLEIGIRGAYLADMLLNADGTSAGVTAPSTGEADIILTVSARLKRTGMEKKLLVEQPGGRSGARVDTNLLKLVARAHELRAIFTQGGRPISEMADAAGLSSSYFTRLLRLSFLAPDITRAILGGRQPAELNAYKIMADTRLPQDWQQQRVRLGLA